MVIGPEESPLPALRVARCGNWSWALGNGNVLLVEQGHGDAFKHEVDNEDDNEDDSRDYSEDYSEDYSYAAVMVRPPCARPVPALCPPCALSRRLWGSWGQSVRLDGGGVWAVPGLRRASPLAACILASHSALVIATGGVPQVDGEIFYVGATDLMWNADGDAPGLPPGSEFLG